MHYQTDAWRRYMHSGPATASAAAAEQPLERVERLASAAAAEQPLERVERLASENAVVIFSISSCCMCHAIKQLFCGMGVNPTVYELDEDPRGKDMEKALITLLAASPPVLPVVFIGGKLVGAMDRVMASHINGTLVPLLKQAGALWL